MRAQEIAFERRYSDDSGVELGIVFCEDDWNIKVEATGGSVSFDAKYIDFAIKALQAIKANMEDNPE